MPSQKTSKTNVPKDYYLVRGDGVKGSDIFASKADYYHFVSLLEKYLTDNDAVRMLSYCLLPDHYHFLLCQLKKGGGMNFMHNIITRYNIYFFDKYNIDDLLSDVDYHVSIVPLDNLLDASRHIHVLPDDWMDYPYTSIRAYFYDDVPTWLDKTHIACKYGSAEKYLKYLEDYRKIRDEAIIV